MKDKIKNLIERTHVANWGEEEQNTFLDTAGNMIEEATLIRAVNLIPEEKKSEYETLLDKGEFLELEQFLIQNVPEFEEILAEEILNFNNNSLELIKKLGL